MLGVNVQKQRDNNLMHIMGEAKLHILVSVWQSNLSASLLYISMTYLIVYANSILIYLYMKPGRGNVWKLERLLPSRKCFKTNDTKTGSCRLWGFLITPTSWPSSIASTPQLRKMRFSSILFSNMSPRRYIASPSIISEWIKECLWYLWKFTLTRW